MIRRVVLFCCAIYFYSCVVVLAGTSLNISHEKGYNKVEFGPGELSFQVPSNYSAVDKGDGAIAVVDTTSQSSTVCLLRWMPFEYSQEVDKLFGKDVSVKLAQWMVKSRLNKSWSVAFNDVRTAQERSDLVLVSQDQLITTDTGSQGRVTEKSIFLKKANKIYFITFMDFDGGEINPKLFNIIHNTVKAL